jgi:hypothetical protein
LNRGSIRAAAELDRHVEGRQCRSIDPLE